MSPALEFFIVGLALILVSAYMGSAFGILVWPGILMCGLGALALFMGGGRGGG
jgi:hypothetical protein